MSDKFIDLTDIAKPLVEDYAQAFGKRLPQLLQDLEDWLQKKGLKLPAEVVETAKNAISSVPKELIEMAAGVVTAPRKIFPQGKIGDVLHHYANDIIDEIGRGLSEKPKAEAKGGADKTAGRDGGNAGPKPRLGYVVHGRWYPSDCTHMARPFSGKGNKTPEDITLEEALARNHSYCRDCVRDVVPAAAKPDSKPAPTTEEPKPAPKEHPLPRADETLFDRWQQLRDDISVEHDGDLLLYRGKWAEFVHLTEHDHELKGKFLLAFTRRGTYDQFKKLVCLSHGSQWSHQLDLLLGESKPSASLLKRKAAEETEQWSRAVKGITAALKGYNEGRLVAIAKDDEEIAALKERYYGKNGSGSAWGWVITIGALAILSVSVYFIGNA